MKWFFLGMLLMLILASPVDAQDKGDGGHGTATTAAVAPFTRYTVRPLGYDYWTYHYSVANLGYGVDTIQVRRRVAGKPTRIPIARVDVWYVGAGAAADSARIVFYDADGDSAKARLAVPSTTGQLRTWSFYPRAQYARFKCLGGSGLHKWQIWAYYER